MNKYIHCKTKAEFKKVLEKCEEMGMKWNDGDKPLRGIGTFYYHNNGDGVVLYIEEGILSIESFKASKYIGLDTTSASEFLGEITEKTEYKPGDILVEKDGNERKLLKVGYLMSFANNFEEEGCFWSKEEMKNWKLRNSITKKEAEKRLGLIIKD